MRGSFLDVFEAIRNRRSIRAFTDEPVSDEELSKLIDSARWAPSAGNVQPWEFIVIRSPEVKSKLSEAAGNQAFIEEAPVVIVVCANQQRSSRSYGSRGVNLYCLQDTAAVTQNLMLAAWALGLATCWVGAFNEQKTREILNIPDSVRPVVIVPMGHSAEKPRMRSRRSLNEIVHYEAFGSGKRDSELI